MESFTTFNNFLNEEATTSWKKMMQGVKSSETGPWSLVAIENKKVVSQKIDIKTKEIIPAHYEAMKKGFPRAKIHIEDGTGMVVWNESLKLDENFPGPGETVDAKDLDYDMLDYFSRTNKVLLIDTKSKKGIKGSVGKMHGDLVFNGDSINKKDIVRVKILESIDENIIELDESLINEEMSTAFLILMNAAIVNGLLIGQMASSGGDGGFTPIADLKRWWQKRKSDKALKSIIDKIKDDEDVVEFMKLTPAQQRGKFRSLIATKLTGDELEYLNKINRSHFKNESVSSVNEEKYTIIDPNGNSMGAAEKTQVMLAAKKKGGVQSGYFVVPAKNALKAKRALEKFKGDFRNPKLKDIMSNLFDESVDEEVSTINDRYIPLFEEFTNLINEDRQITVKRKYTEKYPANTVGHFAKVRNNVLEAIADGTITQEQFDAIVSKISNSSKRWVRSNANCFVISEEGVSLSSLGKKILKGITVNEKTTKNPQVWVPGAFDKEVSTLKTSQITKEKVIELAKKHEVGVVDAIAYVEYGWNLDLK